MKQFGIMFRRIRGIKASPFFQRVTAPSLNELEQPIRDHLEQLLDHDFNHTITFDPSTRKGQFNYGLEGEFEVINE